MSQVSRIHVHPDYNIHNYYGDIAILMLNTPIEYNKYVKPICVWEESPGISEIVGKEGMVRSYFFFQIIVFIIITC